MIGRILKNRYKVEAAIGRGAMGYVYRATDLQSQDVVAIKTISHDYLDDEEVQRRFGREVRILQKIQHPNVISYVDAFKVGLDAYLVMEYLSGGTLHDAIKQRGAMPVGLFTQYMLAIMDAVATAHDSGVYHRDLKPDNILMTAAGVPKVADFGLSKLNEASRLTATGTMMGTLVYMAPEALDALAGQDHRVDIWALGVIMYEMLSGGHLPFKGRSDAAVITSILQDEPESLVIHRRDLPPAWYDVIDFCLKKEPTERYQSVRDVADDLQRETSRFYHQSPDGAARQMVVVETAPSADLPAIVPLTPPNAPQKSGYQLQFLSEPEQPTVRINPTQPLQPSRQADAAPSGRSSFGALIASGLFIWIGIITMMGSAAVGVMSFTQSEPGLSGENLRLLIAVGAMLFIVGVFFELPDTAGWRRIFTLALMFWAGVTWLVFFSGMVFPPAFLTVAFGLVAYALMILGYFQMQSI